MYQQKAMGPSPRCRTFYHSKFSSPGQLPPQYRPGLPPALRPYIKKDLSQPLVAFTKEDYKNAELRELALGQRKKVMASRHGRNMKIELRYGLFSKLNFEIRQYGRSYYFIKLTVVYTQCPLFYNAEQRPGDYYTRYTRFNPQKAGKEGFWKKFFGSTAMQMSFVLNRTELFSFLDSLSNSTASCSIQFSPVMDNLFNPHRIDLYLLTEMNDCPWNIRYCIEAIKSCGDVGLFFMDYVLYVKNERINVKENGIFNETWALRLFSAMYEFLKSDISLSSLEFSPDNQEQRQKRDDGFVMIKTVSFLENMDVFNLSPLGLYYSNS
uniref:Uncharacterized protein n=1 Tax=Panagrolaimus davidi TaxID=227884 RepID=A0A914PWS6_9BILA